MSVRIDVGMSLLDAAINSAGSIEDLFAIARLNGYNITDQPLPGTVLEGTGLKYQASSPPTIYHLTTKPVAVMEGQTLADLAIQQLGSIEALFDLSRLNGYSITNTLINGQILNYSITPVNKQILKQYTDNGYKPASSTSIQGQEQPDHFEGIDYWIIDNDFITS